jgi:hypothetical protein
MPREVFEKRGRSLVPVDEDALVDFIKIKTGHVRTVIDPETGHVFMVPKSIAVDEMDNAEFRPWFDQAVQFICETLLARQDWAWLRHEIEQAVDARNPFYRESP